VVCIVSLNLESTENRIEIVSTRNLPDSSSAVWSALLWTYG